MGCHNCKSIDECIFIDKRLCKKCFLDIVEKTVRKNLRLSKKISKNSKLIVIGPLAKYFVEKIVTVPCEIIFKDSISNNDLEDSSATFIVGHSLDDLASDFLENLFKGKIVSEKKDARLVNIFRNLPVEVLEKFAEIKDLPFNAEKSKTKKFLKTIEAKHQGIKSGLLKSIDIIEEVIENQ